MATTLTSVPTNFSDVYVQFFLKKITNSRFLKAHLTIITARLINNLSDNFDFQDQVWLIADFISFNGFWYVHLKIT